MKKNVKFICPICNREFGTWAGLSKHVARNEKESGMTREELFTKIYHNGERPKCKCGCGEYTTLTYENGMHYREYILGHAARINNNWGHNEKAKVNSANTRRERFSTGEIVQWNKGTKWEETYDEETCKRLMAANKSEERSEKISKYFKGRKKSPEHVEKIREIARTPENRKMLSERMHDRIINKKFDLQSDIEKEFEEIVMKGLDIEYVTQWYIKDIRQYCDFYIHSKNLVIEFNGDFWHCNPIKYPNGALYEYQKKKIVRDKTKEEWLKENNINYHIVWESEYKNDVDKVIDKLKNIIKHILI
jgi:G:T-mismatch repair DNA endonuclease (very short patch repair protein)